MHRTFSADTHFPAYQQLDAKPQHHNCIIVLDRLNFQLSTSNAVPSSLRWCWKCLEMIIIATPTSVIEQRQKPPRIPQ
uniref:Uncharacterized protein n=1 Tax=Physcomitrium patens TaxID=3218 RepID=A0A2K1JTN7_PHYPA|nr:hypothetical protein PHYPA_014657 [Physcomitrium patens]